MKKFWIWLRCFLTGHGPVTGYKLLEKHPQQTYLWTCTRCKRRFATVGRSDLCNYEYARKGTTFPVNLKTETDLINKWSKE